MRKININELIADYNFVVPEIQREYVWGAKKNKQVLVQFLHDLNEKLSKGNANIGFLYSYQSGKEHYLIDGQQRYTTIILLLYYLSAKEGEEELASLQKKLRLDEILSAFSYRVRSYTESFLHNLLVQDVVASNDIRDQVWFKGEYANDTTRDSMIGALDIFEEVMDTCPHLKVNSILEHVYFWYFDVALTSQGEELYITMNSRGEKLSDSEQIKPRLLQKAGDKKHYYGKAWDNWEEFFYATEIRGKRSIATIDTAMNNLVRIALELKTKGKHDHIEPVEDSELLTIQDIEKCFDALMVIYKLYDGKYIPEIKRLYGDSTVDGNFYTLKGLLIEAMKGVKDNYEFEQVYQTIINHVRRNKLNHIAYLEFLSEYRKSCLSWYDFTMQGDNEVVSKIINGHELEKINICQRLGREAEVAIWTEQARPFWNGDIKQLIDWAKIGGSFDLSEFKRISNNFNLLFDKKEDEGWTSDNVRQALITRKLKDYPLNGLYFGYSSSKWKEIMKANSQGFLDFLNQFNDVDKAHRDEILEEMKEGYPETPENRWAEFVHYDCLLAYCNTKHVQNYRVYGIECVKNSYKQPVSVKNMELEDFLSHHTADLGGFTYWMDTREWRSVLWVYKDYYPVRFYFEYRKDNGGTFEVEVAMYDNSVNEKFEDYAKQLGFKLTDNRFLCILPNNHEEILHKIIEWTSIPYSND